MPKQAQTHRYIVAWQRPTINDDFQMTYCQLIHDFHYSIYEVLNYYYKYVVVVDKYKKYNQTVWENGFNNRN